MHQIQPKLSVTQLNDLIGCIITERLFDTKQTDVGTGLLHPCSWQDKEMSIFIPNLSYNCLEFSGEIALLLP